jgi:two-component sensor histidine kinase
VPVRLSLDVVPALVAPRAARREVAAHLCLPADVAGDVDLIVSELVANAVRHGAPPIHLTASVDDRVLRIEVHDHNPTMGQPTPDSRGLAIVTALTSQNGVTPDGDDGKSVWAELPVPEATCGETGDLE